MLLILLPPQPKPVVFSPYHPLGLAYILPTITGKKFPTISPGPVYFLCMSPTVQGLMQTQELEVDSRLTALGIKETTQQDQSMLDTKRDYEFLVQL